MGEKSAGRIIVLIACVSLSAGVAANGARIDEDPLPSWQSGTARDAIVTFVERVTDPAGADFVAPEDRLAVFDHDGTLMVEQPAAFQFAFIFDRVQTLARNRPEWASTQPFQAVIEDDLAAMRSMNFETRRTLGRVTSANMTQDEFDSLASAFIATSRHPRFQRHYTDAVYQPMLELIKLLQANDFKVFIVSGSGIEFIRAFSETVYGIPRENVIGSSRKLDLREQDGRLVIYRKSAIANINGARFKPLNIQLHAGRRPILAVGNSDGDFEMLRFTESPDKPSLVLLVQHDDPDREYAYSDDSIRVRQAARDHGWQVVSMREDFKRVFPPGRAPWITN